MCLTVTSRWCICPVEAGPSPPQQGEFVGSRQINPTFDLTLFLPPLFCPSHPPPLPHPPISFPAKKFKKVLGKETYSEILESTPSLEKEKFPQDYFPEVSVLDKWRWIGTLRAHIAPTSKSLFLISGSVSLLGSIIQNYTIELQKVWFYLSLFHCAASHQKNKTRNCCFPPQVLCCTFHMFGRSSSDPKCGKNHLTFSALSNLWEVLE